MSSFIEQAILAGTNADRTAFDCNCQTRSRSSRLRAADHGDHSQRPSRVAGRYAKRFRTGLRVGTSIAEGTANFLVNRRMNESQKMRWSRNGAELLLQVRCAIYNTLRAV